MAVTNIFKKLFAPKKKSNVAIKRRKNISTNINRKVNAYNKGNKTALNNVAFTNLVKWAIQSNRLSPSGAAYTKKFGRWYGVNSGRRVNKNTIISNINLSRF